MKITDPFPQSIQKVCRFNSLNIQLNGKMTEKQKLAKVRNWMKFRLIGTKGLFNNPLNNHFTQEEKDSIKRIYNEIDFLLENHDDNSRQLGLKVPFHRCSFCSKPGTYVVKTKDFPGVHGSAQTLCKNHFLQKKKDGYVGHYIQTPSFDPRSVEEIANSETLHNE